MKISVIVPVYRVEKYLRQCVDSVFYQTYRDLELILVVDGSPDKCSQICDEYAASDFRIIVIQKNNGGLSDARNVGLSVASGEYVLFVDSDDWLADSGGVAALAARAEKTSADVISFSYTKIYEDDNRRVPCLVQKESMPLTLESKERQLEYLGNRGLYIASACNKLIRISCIRENGLRFAVGETSEDVVWCLKLLIASSSQDYLNRNIYCYRQRAGSITQTLSIESCRQLAQQIMECEKLSRTAKSYPKAYMIYTAYQFATFMKVQTFAESYPRKSVEQLKKYAWLLRYHTGNVKIKMLRRMVTMIGYSNTCGLLYLLSRDKHRGG